MVFYAYATSDIGLFYDATIAMPRNKVICLCIIRTEVGATTRIDAMNQHLTLQQALLPIHISICTACFQR